MAERVTSGHRPALAATRREPSPSASAEPFRRSLGRDTAQHVLAIRAPRSGIYAANYAGAALAPPRVGVAVGAVDEPPPACLTGKGRREATNVGSQVHDVALSKAEHPIHTDLREEMLRRNARLDRRYSDPDRFGVAKW